MGAKNLNKVLNKEKNEEFKLRLSLGRIIRRHRLLQDIKIKDMVEKTKISNSYLVEIERGNGNISIAILFKIATVLNVSPSQLLKEAEECQSSRAKDGDLNEDCI